MDVKSLINPGYMHNRGIMTTFPKRIRIETTISSIVKCVMEAYYIDNKGLIEIHDNCRQTILLTKNKPLRRLFSYPPGSGLEMVSGVGYPPGSRAEDVARGYERLFNERTPDKAYEYP